MNDTRLHLLGGFVGKRHGQHSLMPRARAGTIEHIATLLVLVTEYQFDIFTCQRKGLARAGRCLVDVYHFTL